MHRRLALVLLLGVCACDEQSSSSDNGSSSGPTWPVESQEDRPKPLISAVQSGLVQEASAAGPAPSLEGVGGAQRALFDGDSRLASLGGGGTPVAAGGYWGPGRKQKLALTEGRKDTLKPGHVPPPANSLPEVDLPDAQPGVGPKGGGPTLLAFDAFQTALGDWAAPLLSRVGWGARKPKNPHSGHKPYRVTVHHTQSKMTSDASSTIDRVRGIQYYHMYGRGKEGKDVWDDIGYHFLIDGAGRIVEGRPVEVIGAHAGGSNDGNIGIALIGDFNKDKPTEAQLRSLERLASFLAVKFRRDPSYRGFLEPHMHFNSTDCPGKNLLAQLETVRGNVDAQADSYVKKFKDADFQPVLVTQR